MLRLQTTGIKIDYGYAGQEKEGWTAECKWHTLEKHCRSGNMEGTIGTRYFEPTIEQAINQVLELIVRFNIEKMEPFALYRNKDVMQTQNILQNIRDEADKRGWKYYF